MKGALIMKKLSFPKARLRLLYFVGYLYLSIQFFSGFFLSDFQNILWFQWLFVILLAVLFAAMDLILGYITLAKAEVISPRNRKRVDAVKRGYFDFINVILLATMLYDGIRRLFEM